MALIQVQTVPPPNCATSLIQRLIHPLCSPGPSPTRFESRMVCAHVGANATADYNATADDYGMHGFACVYKDLTLG